MKTKLKDIIIIAAIVSIAASGFYMFNKVFKNTTFNRATVVQLNLDSGNYEKIVEVDFVNKEVVVIDNYIVNDITYPIIDESNNTITLLGLEQEGIRYKFVIKYNMDKRSMEVIEEESPKNYSSKVGEQTAQPIISVPNAIQIHFSNDGEIDIDDTI